MARFNEILVGRYNRALQKAFGIKGGPPVPQLSSEIMAQVLLFWGVENRYLESWQRFGVGFSQPAAAGFNSVFELRNPTANNALIVIEKVTIFNVNAAANSTNFEGPAPLSTDLATSLVSSTVRFDARGQQQPSSVASEQNNAALASFANTPYFASLAPNGAIDMVLYENQEIPILPGDAIRLRNPTVNTALQGSVQWRERFLEDSERF